MKKLIFSFAAFSAILAGCQVNDLDENNTQQDGEAFYINATIPSTKTILTPGEGLYNVEWEENEELSVVATYTDGSQSKGYKFTKGEGNTFSGQVTSPESIGGIYVIYPYSDTHDSYNDTYNNINGFITVGSEADAEQIQAGINSTAHIKGNLCGYAAVSDGTASVTMQHAATLFEVILSNKTGEDLPVSKISITNSENDPMTGSFYIAPQSGSLTPSSSKYISSTAALNVSGDNTTVANEGTAKFYIVSAPFDLAVDATLTITVTMTDGKTATVVKTIPAVEKGKFEAGKVNHINVEIAETEEVVPLAIPGSVTFTDKSDNPSCVTVNQNNARYSDGSLKLAETDEYVIVTTADAVGSIDVNIKYNGNSPSSTLDILGSADGGDYTLIETIGPDNGIGSSQSTVSTTKPVDASYRYFKFNMNKSSANFAIYELKFNEQITEPFISTDTDELEFNYDEATSGAIEYYLVNAEYNDVAVSCDASLSGWFTAEKSTDGVISYTVSANDTENDRSGNVTISVTGGNSIIIPVTQSGKPAEGLVIDVLTADLLNLTSKYTNVSGIKAKSNAVFAANAMKNGSNIQMRDSKSSQEPSGIITTASGGKVKSINIVWGSETPDSRVLNIYGSNTPYTSVSDIYSAEPIATIPFGETSADITGDYTYIGVKSSDGSLYLTSIEIVWDTTE